jgi:hypothetical protein
MSARGAAGLYVADIPDGRRITALQDRRLVVVVGTGHAPAFPAYAAARGLFDFSMYGTPGPGGSAPHAHIDASYTLRLGAQSNFLSGPFHNRM